MLAYSSVAQIGYIILGISLGTAAGLTASVVHIINHALAKAALFIAVGAVMMQVGGVRLSDFRGIGKYMPFTMAGFVLAGLSLIGVPLTAGFVSKWLLLKALIDNGQWLIVAAVLVSSLLAVVYVWRVVERAYFHERKPRLKKVREAPLMVQVALWIMVVLSIVFGIYTEATVGVAQQVAIYLTQT